MHGSIKSLGKEYTKERIRERIENKVAPQSILKKKATSSDRLIDTSGEKFQSSPGLKKWADIQNLKLAAQTYSQTGSLAELEQKLAVKTEAGKSAKQSVLELEHHMKNLAGILKYAEQYKANRSCHLAYKKAKNPDAYFRKHESELILYGGARRMLEQAGISLKGLNVEKLNAEYHALEVQRKELVITYKNCEKEVRELKQKLNNLNQYLGRETEEKSAGKQTKEQLQSR